MPIFAQSAVSGRVTGTSLGRLRFRDDDQGSRLSAQTTGRDRTEATQEDTRTHGLATNASLNALLSRNQRAELILQRLQQLRAEAQSDTGTKAAGDTAQSEDGGGLTTAAAAQTATPGVGRSRTTADAAVDRPGRLYPGTTSLIINRTQNPVGRLSLPDQATATGLRTNVAELPTANRPETPPLDRARDASIRLLATQTAAQAAEATAAEADETPTAEQISRANTTEEIRTNLQAGTRAVGSELQAEAARETAATANRITRAAEQAGEQQQEQTVEENRQELQDLRTEERQLERDLAQTEREIRSRENQNARLQTGVSDNPTATAVALGSRLNILSV